MSKKILTYGFSIFYIIIFTVFIFIYSIGKNHSELKQFKYLGNFESNVKQIILSDPNEIKFSYIGDTNNTTFRSVLNLIMKDQSEGASFIILGGDLSRFGTVSRYKYALNEISSIAKVPIFFVQGNHDVDPNPTLFKPYLGEADFQFQLGNLLIVIMNNSKKDLSARQLDWLEGIARGREEGIYKNAILFTHRPLTDVPDYNYDNEQIYPGVTDFDRLLQILKVGNFSGTFCGHLHTYEVINKEGVDFVIAGGGRDKKAGIEMKTNLNFYYDSNNLKYELRPHKNEKHFTDYFIYLSVVTIYPLITMYWPFIILYLLFILPMVIITFLSIFKRDS